MLIYGKGLIGVVFFMILLKCICKAWTVMLFSKRENLKGKVIRRILIQKKERIDN